MIKNISDISQELEKLRDAGIQKGDNTGFECLDRIYSVKPGSYTIILGAPGHGKSEIIFELLFNQSTKYGKRHLIYSPETGSVAEIVAELVHKYTYRPFYKTNSNHCDDKEFYNALNWIEHHFLIVDSDERSYSLKELFNMVDTYEKSHPNEKINTIMAEPYNEISHDMSKYGSRQDLYIEEFIGDIRRYCKKNNIHFFLSVHPGYQQLKEFEGIRYYPMPTAREASGGQAMLRKAMTWINIWRPHPKLRNEHGLPYQENEVLINVEKAKPKGVSFKGTVSLYFDWKRNRYYEIRDGLEFYAFQHESNASTLLPSPEFNITTDQTGISSF